MIKFNTQLGSKHLNIYAREQKELLQPLVKGMHCSKCSTDTTISFEEDAYGHLKFKIHSCCPEFEQRIKMKLFKEE